MNAIVQAIGTKPTCWFAAVPMLNGVDAYDPVNWAIGADWAADNQPRLENKLRISGQVLEWVRSKVMRPSIFNGFVRPVLIHGRICTPFHWLDHQGGFWTCWLWFRRKQVQFWKGSDNPDQHRYFRSCFNRSRLDTPNYLLNRMVKILANPSLIGV